MKIEVIRDVQGITLNPPVSKHTDRGTGDLLIAAGVAREVFPEPIPHKPTVWVIKRYDDGGTPCVLAKCNCKNGVWQFTGLGPLAKLEVRHVLCNREGLEVNLPPGDYVSLGGYDSNLRPVKIVVEHCPPAIEQEYRNVYSKWANQFARKPRVNTVLDEAQKDREMQIMGRGYGPVWIDANKARP